MGDLTANFSRSEFECRCGCGLCIADFALVALLQELRTYYDRTIFIDSATRCEQHNADAGGGVTSQHLLGLAADIRVSGISSDQVQAELRSRAGDRWGIGSYDAFTHIDVRRVAARWDS